MVLEKSYNEQTVFPVGIVAPTSKLKSLLLSVSQPTTRMLSAYDRAVWRVQNGLWSEGEAVAYLQSIVK